MSEVADALTKYFDMAIQKARLDKGGKGSGFFGHAGRPGQRGGSAAAGGGAGGGGAASLSGAQIEEEGTLLDWKNEETVTGQIVITGVNTGEGEPTQDDVAAWLQDNLDTLWLQGGDIEEIEFDNFEVGGDYVYAEVSILPTEEAAESWMGQALESEAVAAWAS